MNKNQLTMAVIGGVALVAVLGIGYFIYDQSDIREQAENDLESQVSIFNQNRKATRAEEKAIKANSARLTDWTAAATAGAAGLTNAMRYVERMTPPVFKLEMLKDVRRFEASPEKATVKIVTEANVPTVFSDFKDYIGGAVPTEDKIRELQRQWGDVCLVVDTLLDAGAQSLESVKVETPPPVPADPKDRAADVPEAVFDAQKYTFVFLARPEALVRTLNALATTELFISVDQLSFVQDPDPLKAMLDKTEDSAAAGRASGRRSRRRQVEEKAEGEAAAAPQVARSGTVTDPADPRLCTPFRVTMTVSTLAVKAKEERK